MHYICRSTGACDRRSFSFHRPVHLLSGCLVLPHLSTHEAATRHALFGFAPLTSPQARACLRIARVALRAKRPAVQSDSHQERREGCRETWSHLCCVMAVWLQTAGQDTPCSSGSAIEGSAFSNAFQTTSVGVRAKLLTREDSSHDACRSTLRSNILC